MGNHKNLIGMQFGRLTVVGKPVRIYSAAGNSRLAWPCLCTCGVKTQVTTTNLTRTKNPTVSCGCYRLELSRSQPTMQNSKSWRGGRIKDTAGYVLVYNKAHPRAKSNGYVREHIVIMEQILGRRLLKNENVHHINGFRDDNRPSNLELWCTSQPSGQRVSDKLKWAKEFIKIYG